MRVVIAGGSGSLGSLLSRALVADGHEVVVLTRSPGPSEIAGVREAGWSPSEGGTDKAWHAEIDGAGAVVNLAGASIADKRWTEARKRLILTSRVEPTRALAVAVQKVAHPPATFIQGSAIGHYGATLDDVTFDETSPPGDDFLGRVCAEWEAAARPVEAAGSRLAIIRTGLVLDPDAGLVPEMSRPFKLFVGGPVASGRQAMSWIHRDDWVRLASWAIATADVTGPLNACSPNPVTNAEFSRALGRALGRPSWAPVPGFVLRLLFGELADDLLIKGTRALPTRPLALGFQFRFTSLDAALDDLLG